MARQLNEESRKLGLQLNAKRTKVMRNRFADTSAVWLDQTTLEDTDEYVYLERLINMGNDLKPEIIRRRRAAWAAYNTIKPAATIRNKATAESEARINQVTK
ncbi:hypothetical protein Aduo_009079 [Ancylostoma duodenale]